MPRVTRTVYLSRYIRSNSSTVSTFKGNEAAPRTAGEPPLLFCPESAAILNHLRRGCSGAGVELPLMRSLAVWRLLLLLIVSLGIGGGDVGTVAVCGEEWVARSGPWDLRSERATLTGELIWGVGGLFFPPRCPEGRALRYGGGRAPGMRKSNKKEPEVCVWYSDRRWEKLSVGTEGASSPQLIPLSFADVGK